MTFPLVTKISIDILTGILIVKNLQKNIVYIGVVLAVLGVSYQYFHMRQKAYLQVTSFASCVEAGYKVLATYPEQCVLYGKHFSNPLQQKSETNSATSSELSPIHYKDQLYIIEGAQVYFHDGKGELPANPILKQSSSSLIITGEPFLYDINNDNIKDLIFLMHTDNKNTKKTYYITSSLSLHKGFYGSNALFLDYDVNNSKFLYKNGEIVVSYTTGDTNVETKEKYFTLENDILKQLLNQ